MGVEDDLTCGGESVPVLPSAVTLVEQVERGLGAGEVAEGLGAAYVERLGRAEGLLQCGAVDQGVVEVEGVGDVEVGLEVQGAGVVDVVLVDRDVTRVDGEVAVLGIGGGVDGRRGRSA